MKIKNEAKKYFDDPVVTASRRCFVARGEYLYHLINEAHKAGLPIDFAHKAIYTWGDQMRHKLNNPDTTDFQEFMDTIFTELECKVWEDEITVTENEMRVEFHYCPLLEGWMRNTQDVEALKELCDIAMECDVALFSNPAFDYSLEKTFFTGADHCAMVIRKKK